MKTIELDVEVRTTQGKGFNRRTRAGGKIPAVLYGKGIKNVHLQTGTKIITKYLLGHNENAIYNLKCSDPQVNGKHVIVKDWDRDAILRTPLHCDFLEVDLTKEIRVKVLLHFVGKAKGLAEGGIVQPIVRELEVECLPTQIPDHIEVDVSNLGIGDSLHVEELVVPSNVKKVFHDNYTVVTCTFIKEEVIAATPAEGAVAAAEPEVIAKGKKDEEGAEGAKPAAGGKAPAAPAKDAKKDDKK